MRVPTSPCKYSKLYVSCKYCITTPNLIFEGRGTWAGQGKYGSRECLQHWNEGEHNCKKWKRQACMRREETGEDF